MFIIPWKRKQPGGNGHFRALHTAVMNRRVCKARVDGSTNHLSTEAHRQSRTRRGMTARCWLRVDVIASKGSIGESPLMSFIGRFWKVQERGFGPYLVEDTERHDSFGHTEFGLCKPET